MKSAQTDVAYQAAETLRNAEITLASLLDNIRATLAKIEGAAQPSNFGESSDPLDYRVGRNPTRGLSQLGKDVMTAMIRAGLSDKEIGERMVVTPSGVGFFRREALGIRKHT